MRAQGWRFDVGVGPAAGHAQSDLYNQRKTAVGAYLRVGHAVSERAFVGVEAFGWTQSVEGAGNGLAPTGQKLGILSLIVSGYVHASDPFVVKVGVGAMAYHADLGAINETPLTALAPAVTLGFGYDVRVSSRIFLTPFANGYITPNVNYDLAGQTRSVTDAYLSVNLIQLGISLTSRSVSPIPGSR